MLAGGSNAKSHFEKNCSRSTEVAVFQQVRGEWRWPLPFQYRYYKKTQDSPSYHVTMALRTFISYTWSSNGCWLFAITFLLQSPWHGVSASSNHPWVTFTIAHSLHGKLRYVCKEHFEGHDSYSWNATYTTSTFQQREYFSTQFFSFGHHHYFELTSTLAHT